jgi:prepilin-type N-terminal cleavage/methylation domain-containing protein
MKTMRNHRVSRSLRAAGFTLIEFIAAMAIFVTVGGAAFMLFRQDVPLFNQQQNMSGLNIAIQNAVLQIQQDVENAGTGYYVGTNLPSFPVGVTISNTTSTTSNPCQGANYTYNSTCFDTLSIITTDPNTPPQSLPAACITTTSSPITLGTTGTTAALTALAGHYHQGDELLLVNGSGTQMMTVTVTANASVVSNAVSIPINTTGNVVTSPNVAPNTATTDPLNITTHANVYSDNGYAQWGNQFCNNDFLLRLQPTVYSVDTTSLGSPSNPKLIRTQGGTSNIIAEQIIGFRVGAALWNGITTDTTNPKYNYNASTYGISGYDFTLVRSVRVSIIGRTNLGTTGLYNYQNAFDGGPYQILGAAIVVNPRNLSMGDNN